MTNGPSREDLLAVLTFGRRFEDPDFVAGAWVSPARYNDGARMLGYWVPSEDVTQWQSAVYEHRIVLPFDWTDPQWTRRMRRYQQDVDQSDDP